MTIGPDLSVDPAQAYLDAGVQASEDPEAAHDRVGVVVAAGLLTTFALMAAALRAEPAPATEGAARELLERIWRKAAPTWLQIAVPALRYAIELGRTSGMESADLAAVADAYAESLGDYAHATSADALLSGFRAQLNAGWSSDLAWRRAAMGYGLDERGMRQFITPLLSRPTTYTADLPAASVQLLAKLLHHRASAIAGNESYHVSQLGRALTWQYQAATGLIPPDAQKRWVTADDEMVCPICGPLHNVVVPLGESFETPDGARLVVPGVHPNCRCRVELAYAVLSKAWDETRVKRDREGQFSRTEQRIRTADPERAKQAAEVAEMLREAAERYDTPQMVSTGMTPAAEMTRAPQMTRAVEMTPASDGMTAAEPQMTRAMVKDTPFGAMVRAKSTTRRITEIYWLPDEKGQQVQHEDVREESFDSPTAEFHNTVVLNGAEYFNALVNHMTSPEGRDRFDTEGWEVPEAHPMLNLKVGDIVDIDATALGTAHPDGQWVPPAMVGIVDSEGELGVNWIPKMANWSAYKDDQHSELADEGFSNIDQYSDWRSEEVMYERQAARSGDYGHAMLEDWTEDPVLQYFGDDDIDNLAVQVRKSGGTIPVHWAEMSSEGKREYVWNAMNLEEGLDIRNRTWTNHAEGHLKEIFSREVSGGYAAAGLMDATAKSVSPDLFVFRGHFGPTPGVVEGQYRVQGVRFHRLDANQRDFLESELIDTGMSLNDQFDEVRVFVLEPYSPPWVPQSPEDLRRGMPRGVHH